MVDDLGTPISKLGREQTGKLIKSIDDILTDKALKDIVPEEAVEALFKANKFFREGNDVFTRGVTSTLLKNAGQDGLIIGKDAKAMQNVFKQVAGQDNVMSAKQSSERLMR